MMKKVNLVDFGDLLEHAMTVGYYWNQAHDILVGDNIPSMNETPTREFWSSDVNHYGWSEDTIKIMSTFFEEKKVDTFTFTLTM